MNQLQALFRYIGDNAVEVWIALSLFVGIPIVISLYLDYRAGLAWFFVASVVVGVLGMRRS